MVPYRAVYEDPVSYVRLEVDDDPASGLPARMHVETMRAEDVARILGGISVKEDRIWLQRWLQGEALLMPAFRGTRPLVSADLRGLRSGTTDERVTFTSFKRPSSESSPRAEYASMALNCISFWELAGPLWYSTYGMIYDRLSHATDGRQRILLVLRSGGATITQRHSLWDTLLASTNDELVIDLAKPSLALSRRSQEP